MSHALQVAGHQGRNKLDLVVDILAALKREQLQHTLRGIPDKKLLALINSRGTTISRRTLTEAKRLPRAEQGL